MPNPTHLLVCFFVCFFAFPPPAQSIFLSCFLVLFVMEYACLLMRVQDSFFFFFFFFFLGQLFPFFFFLSFVFFWGLVCVFRFFFLSGWWPFWWWGLLFVFFFFFFFFFWVRGYLVCKDGHWSILRSCVVFSALFFSSSVTEAKGYWLQEAV